MPSPAIAENKCSTVEICTDPLARVVDKVVSPTFSALALISTSGFKSTLLKIMPVSVGAGLSSKEIGSPLCKQTPKALIELVRLKTNQLYIK